VQGGGENSKGGPPALDRAARGADGSRMKVAAAVLAWSASLSLCAQTEAAAARPPSALVPVAREDKGAIERQDELLRRVRESAPTKILCVGDSITEGWEETGKDVWQRSIAPLGALDLGNSGDRTEHVLWRLQQAPLTRLRPEHVVLLIGTNNLGHHKSTAAETLAGVEAVARLLALQCPQATVHVLEIFPRGQRFDAMRGDVCQINQALRAFVRAANAEAAAAGRKAPRPAFAIHAIGDLFVDADGTISKELMPDFLHLTPKGYAMWAAALLPCLAE
jgi:lysophospholipase L1-like esterase